MNAFNSAKEELETLEVPDIEMEERITSPTMLRNTHTKLWDDDKETSEHRAAVQELMDFVPPYDSEDLEKKGMASRFNVNYGLATSIRNEALGPFLDIFTAPKNLAKIVLKKEVDPTMRDTWADIMSDEWTKMIRSWDLSTANIIQLIDIFVTHGVALTWFEDNSSLNFNVGSLEDCKFDVDAVAVPSKIEIMTLDRNIAITELYAKIEGEEDNENIDGWNGPKVKEIIQASKPKGTQDTEWNFERAARLIKSCRVSSAHSLPTVDLIWGAVKEIDGTISIYATTKELLTGNGKNYTDSGTKEEKWVYKKRKAYKNANEMFQMFTFGVGNKNRVYTIRGMGYALYQPGMADNILRCKMMDSARHRAAEQYQPESDIEDINDLQFIDLGHALIAPKGLKGAPQQNTQRLDEGIGYAIDSNKQILSKHSTGLSGSSISDNPNARRNELQVTAELEHFNKAQGFAVSLFYGPYDKLTRELLRRSYTETQKDILIMGMIERMKEACEERGVPKDVFNKIDFEASHATRLQGAGSKGSRLIAFQQLGELFSSMDPIGQEYYVYDMASEIKGSEAADRYFGTPGQVRYHIDIAIARSENNDLLEGVVIEPIAGENSMVHLEEHIPILIDSIGMVNEGQMDIAEWTMKHIPLYQHCVATLSATSVHPQMMSKLNEYKQTVQQAGEVIENGLRHINKLKEQGDMSQGMDPNGNPIPGAGADPNAPVDPAAQEASAAQKDNDLKMQMMFAKAQAEIEINRTKSEAQMDIERQKAIAGIALKDAATAADIKRKNILNKATGRY